MCELRMVQVAVSSSWECFGTWQPDVIDVVWGTVLVIPAERDSSLAVRTRHSGNQPILFDMLVCIYLRVFESLAWRKDYLP